MRVISTVAVIVGVGVEVVVGGTGMRVRGSTPGGMTITPGVCIRSGLAVTMAMTSSEGVKVGAGVRVGGGVAVGRPNGNDPEHALSIAVSSMNRIAASICV